MKKLFSGILLGALTLTMCSCGDDYKLSIIAPSGAPAISVANIAKNKSEEYDITLGLSPELLKASLTSGDKDVIIAPTNLGCVTYKAAHKYKLASVLTWGNLYFASQKADFKLSDLNNSDIILFGSNTVNDMVVSKVLEANNITPKSKEYLETTALTQAKLLEDSNAIVLIAEPSLSAAKAKKSNISFIDIQALYKDATSSRGFPQAGCFVNIDTVENHKGKIDSFLYDLEESAKLCVEKLDDIAGYAEELNLGGKKPVLVNAIPRCNINYVKASSAKDALLASMDINIKLFGGEKPGEDFYYI